MLVEHRVGRRKDPARTPVGRLGAACTTASPQCAPAAGPLTAAALETPSRAHLDVSHSERSHRLPSTMDARVEPTEQKALTHREARLVIVGMMLPVFMGSLDNTILASALPTIGREFGDVRNLPWLISIYLLASTAVMPLYGKIADIHGRRVTLRIALMAYILGSLVCALAPNMLVLILGRAVHGLGGGGLASLGAVVLGDVAAPKERGRYYAYFAVVYTTAGATGPALGGFLSDTIHWSAIFWLNIPLGIAALAITLPLLRRLPRHERPHPLGGVGAGPLLPASTPFIFRVEPPRVGYAWAAPP